MKALFSMLSLSIATAMALAQNAPPNPAPQETPQSTKSASPEKNTQSDAKGSPTASASTTLPEMKTTTFKGVLVDMSCSSRPATSAQNTPAAVAADQSNTANRSVSDSEASCPVTANSSDMGMKLDGGRTVRF